VKLHTAH